MGFYYSLPMHTEVIYFEVCISCLREELQEVQRMFMQAARINPTEGVDPDVQCGLGILFSLGTDFDKAADCFQSALGANPEVSIAVKSFVLAFY